MNTDFHLGHLIRQELEKQQRTVTWLAKQINVDRTVCYDIFKRRYINIEQLESLSKVLKHNFFIDLAEYEDSVVKNAT
ncbi:MAG: XRE family transcriptional regulator [Bacteroidales bacterium]|nr:XRE family transcriptional regulator [Bacteroidales bacterium]